MLVTCVPFASALFAANLWKLFRIPFLYLLQTGIPLTVKYFKLSKYGLENFKPVSDLQVESTHWISTQSALCIVGG